MASRQPESLSGVPFQTIVPGTTLARSVTSSSAQSAVIPAGVSVIVLSSTTNCHVEFGTNPTATTDSFYLTAGIPFAVGIPQANIAAGNWKVAVIRASADGNLTILPGTNA